MTKQELASALAIARSDRSLAAVDDRALAGLYLPGFVPVSTTIEVVARTLRDLVVQFNGEVDSEALAEFGKISRRRIAVL